MAARLTDRQKKKIVADYVDMQSYNAVGKLNGVSATTVKNLVLKNDDIVEMCERKKEQNAEDILAHMATKRDMVNQIVDKYLAALLSDDKISAATASQLTTALGTIVDKWAMVKGKDDKDDNVVKVIIDV